MNHDREILKKLQRAENRISKLERASGISITNSAIALPLAINLIMGLPTLRGFWPGSSHKKAGSGDFPLSDISGNGQEFAETGAPAIGLDTNRYFSYVQFDGTNDWFSIADNDNFSIQGNEGGTLAAQRGLTMGAFVKFDNTASATEYILSKRQVTNRSYFLARTSGGYPWFEISNTGSDSVYIVHSNVLAGSTWALLVSRFDPSTSVDVFFNGVWNSETSGVFSSIYDGTAALRMAARDVAASENPMAGQIALAWVCAAYIPDEVITRYWNVSRHIFGI